MLCAALLADYEEVVCVTCSVGLIVCCLSCVDLCDVQRSVINVDALDAVLIIILRSLFRGFLCVCDEIDLFIRKRFCAVVKGAAPEGCALITIVLN